MHSTCKMPEKCTSPAIFSRRLSIASTRGRLLVCTVADGCAFLFFLNIVFTPLPNHADRLSIPTALSEINHTPFNLLWQHRRMIQGGRFIKAQHQIHILNGLPGRTFYQVIYD